MNGNFRRGLCGLVFIAAVVVVTGALRAEAQTATRTPIATPTCNVGTRRGVTFAAGASQSIDAGTWNLNPGGDQLTVALWAKVTSLAAQPNPTLLSKWDNNDPANTVLIVNTGAGVGETRVFVSADDGTLVNCVTDTTVTLVLNQWHHVAATLDGTTLTCYVDGVATGSTGAWPAGRTIRQSAHHVRLGGRDDGRYLSGVLDDVRMYNRGLSAAEIAGLYNGSGGTCGGGPSGLIAWWKLDEGGGLTAGDASGNGRTGTLVNGPTWSDAFVCCPPPPTATGTPTPSTASCPATPLAGCATPAKGTLKLIGNAGDTTRQKLLWKWSNGTSDMAAFGDPVAGTTNYRLCVYDDGALKMSAAVAEAGTCDGDPCWRSPGATRFKYKNRFGNADGITMLKLKAGAGNAKILAKGKGAGLALPFPVTDATAVTVQLVKNPGSGPECWEGTFPAPATVNDPVQPRLTDRAP